MLGWWEWRGNQCFQAEVRRWNFEPKEQEHNKQHKMWRDTTGQTTEAEWQRGLPHLLPKDITFPKERTGSQERGDTESALRHMWFWLWNFGAFWQTSPHLYHLLRKHSSTALLRWHRAVKLLLIVWFQLLANLAARKWSQMPVWRREGWGILRAGHWEGLQLFITHT